MSFYEVTENKRARAEKHLHVRYCPFARRPAVTPFHHNPILDTSIKSVAVKRIQTLCEEQKVVRSFFARCSVTVNER